MAKYVCDFAAVNAVGSKLIDGANTLTNSANTYSSSIDSDLSTWSGEAKSNFNSQKSGEVDKILAKAQYMSEFGEFIKNVADSIEELEESLASLSI